jgi:hypothetical protein
VAPNPQLKLAKELKRFDGKELKRFDFFTQPPQLGVTARIGGGMCRVTTGRGASARHN